MKKLSLALVVAVALLLPIFAMIAYAENETSSDDLGFDPEKTVVTYDMLMKFKEEFRAELLEELAAEGGITIKNTYEDIDVKEGEIILLSPAAEVIYRGGGAVAITSSDSENDGITDMSSGTEIFSGEALEYGHIYYLTETDSKAAILILSDKAVITARGSYEIG